jgi:hypothetical protein
MTTQRPEETAAAEAAITDAAAEAEANEPGHKPPTPLQPIYALYPVEWRGDRQQVADEPAADDVEPLSIRDVWRVVNLLARQARDAAPDKEAYDRQVALRQDLLLFGRCYVDAITGERVPPKDVVVRQLFGEPVSAEARGREVLDATLAAGAGTYQSGADWQTATWEWMTGPDGPLTAALDEVNRDLQAEGVLAAGERLVLDTEPV